MTASLPMPQDAHPVEPDGGSGGALGSGSPVRSLPPKPETPADVAAAQKAGEDLAAGATSTEEPRKTPRKSPRTKVADDPGPPPPLPPDLVIPPMPPLPPVIDDVVPDTAEPGTVQSEAAPAEPVVAESALVEPEVDVSEPEIVTSETEPSQAPVVAAQPQPLAVSDAVHVEPEILEPAPAVEEPAPALLRHSAAPIAVAAPEARVAASAGTGASALVVKGVTKAFGDTRAVDGIDLTVPTGIFYGLVGPNGAGKTTTLSMIAGLLRPDRGSIRVNGVDAASDPLGAKRQMGVLPDRLRTFDRLTGRQLLHYYGVLRGLPSAVVESRTADLARAFDLSDSLGRAVSDYSAGMVKKVMLAGAMIHSPGSWCSMSRSSRSIRSRARSSSTSSRPTSRTAAP